MMRPATIAQVTDLERDVRVCKWAPLMHVLRLHLRLLLLLSFLLNAQLLVLNVSLDLSSEVALHD